MFKANKLPELEVPETPPSKLIITKMAEGIFMETKRDSPTKTTRNNNSTATTVPVVTRTTERKTSLF